MDYKRIFILLGAILLLASCQKDYSLELDFALNRENLRFKKQGGQSYFLVYSLGEWTVSLPEGTDWVRLGRTTGQRNQQVSVICDANRHISRGVYATVTNHDGSTKTVYISQEASVSDPYYTFQLQATGLCKLASAVKIPVSTNLDELSVSQAEVSVDGDWIHNVTFSSTTLDFVVDGYTGVGIREGSVTLRFPAAKWDQSRCVAVLTVRQSPDAPKLELDESYNLDPEGANPTVIKIKGNFEPALYPALDFSSFQLGNTTWMTSATFDVENCSLILIPKRNDSTPIQTRSTWLTCYVMDASGATLSQCETLLKQAAADEHYDYSTAVRIGIEGKGSNVCLVEHALGGKFFVDTRYTDNDAIQNIASVGVLWQTVENMVQYPLYRDGKCYFTLAAGLKGNALLGYRNASNQVIWTLHLWIAGEAVESRKLDGKIFMDRNLGATSAVAPTDADNASVGVYYQWGRKDPFPGVDGFAPTGSRNHKAVFPDAIKIEKAQDGKTAQWILQHPSYYVMGTAGGSGAEDWIDTQDADLWGGVSGLKSRYDPCPLGWKVPAKSDFSDDFIDRVKGGEASFDHYGLNLKDDNNKDVFIPASGIWRRTFADVSELANVGTHGWLWTSGCGTINTDYLGGYRLMIQSGASGRGVHVQPHRWGAPVRCVKE